MTTSELAARTGRSSEQVLRRLKELEQTGEAHRTGHRRSTRWHVGPAGATPVAGDEPDAVAL
jgi:predicted transcriptional regulator